MRLRAHVEPQRSDMESLLPSSGLNDELAWNIEDYNWDPHRVAVKAKPSASPGAVPAAALAASAFALDGIACLRRSAAQRVPGSAR